jgi:eukaryotic-like serine/threonine-protein kinase
MSSSNRLDATPPQADGHPPDDRVVVGANSSRGLPIRTDDPTVISSRPPRDAGDGPLVFDNVGLNRGDVLDHYEIIEYVGGGGMGRVFRARDTQLDRRVALKILPLEQAADGETVLRFRNEARSAARLDHENIARVYHVGEHQGIPYLVFEFVEGTTVRALVDEHGPLPLAEAVGYTLQVAGALAHAAEHDVVHRDIKPSNIIVTERGRVKVIDLGLARIQDHGDAVGDLTASGVTLGTFDYISPEQARDPRVVDTRSDIYSLGCAMFFMLSGRPPFPEGTVLQKLLQHQGDKPPDIREVRPELPDEVSRVLGKMMAKDPGDRYQTATELVEELQLLAEHIGLRPMGPGGRYWGMPSERRIPLLARHLPWIAPVAALVCIVVAMDVIWQWPLPNEAVAPLAQPRQFVEATPEQKTAGPPEPPAGDASDSTDAKESVPPDWRLPEENPWKPGTSTPRSSGVSVSSANGSSATPRAPVATNRHPAEDVRVEMPDGIGGQSLLGGLGVPGSDASLDPALMTGGITPAELGWPTLNGDTARAAEPIAMIVGGGKDNDRQYASLAAACSAARTGDIIELCYNGRREERPIDLPNSKLVIRAGAGFQPVVAFCPDQQDPVKYPRSMFTLSHGELSLLGVAVELEIPREASAGRWTLWELGQDARLQLQKCLLTVRNPYEHEVAVFSAKPLPGTDLLDTHPTSGALLPAVIEMSDCVVRGQAVTLCTKALQPVQLSWTNGVLATSEWFLSAVGDDREPAAGEAIEVRLKHLSARVGRGLCLLDNSRFAPCQLPVKFDCSDSIIAVTSPQGAMVEQTGEYPFNLQQAWFTWTGDRNAYPEVAVLWRIDDLSPEASAESLSFDQWRERWAPDHELHSLARRLDFARPLDTAEPVDAFRPEDFRLGQSPENWARGAASDGTDIGAALDRLPTPPTEEGPQPPVRPDGRLKPNSLLPLR